MLKVYGLLTGLMAEKLKLKQIKNNYLLVSQNTLWRVGGYTQATLRTKSLTVLKLHNYQCDKLVLKLGDSQDKEINTLQQVTKSCKPNNLTGS